MKHHTHSGSMALGAESHQSPKIASRAFTLIELLVVIAIIGILLGILLPAIGGVRAAARSASTQSLIRTVRVAIDAFQADNGRLPGYFSPQDMGSTANGGFGEVEFVGFTSMENVLLDLTLPAVQPCDQSNLGDPDPMINTVIDINPLDKDNPCDDGVTVRINIADVGSSSAGAYLSLGGEHLRPIEGQATTIDRANNRQDQVIGMPDVIDYFGQPIMLWRRDTSASLPPRDFGETGASADRFASMSFDPADTDTRASFYWAANAGYLRSGGSETFLIKGVSPGNSPGLGEDRIPQVVASSLGWANSGTTGNSVANIGPSSTPDWVLGSMWGVLGHSKFATEAAAAMWPRPLQARGDIVLISAGRDKVFFGRHFLGGGLPDSSPSANVVGYSPREDAKKAVVDGGSASDASWGPLQTADEYDDIIESTGG